MKEENQRQLKPNVNLELPKQKAEHEKTELEKLLLIQLRSESEANEATKLISNLTNSVMDYHMKGMTPQMQQIFKKQLNQSDQQS